MELEQKMRENSYNNCQRRKAEEPEGRKRKEIIHLLSQQPFYWALINLLDNVPGIWATDMFDIQLFPQGSRYLEKQTCKGNSNGKGAVGEQRKDSLFFFFF